MSEQLTLEESVQTHLHKAGVVRDPLTIATNFRIANPHAYRAIALISLRDVARGITPSIAYCFELLRRPADWPPDVREVMREAKLIRPEGDQFTLNNTGRSALVRMLEAEYPKLNGAFDKRTSRADRGKGPRNATPVVEPLSEDKPSCYPCEDVAHYGDFMCRRCEVTRS